MSRKWGFCLQFVYLYKAADIRAEVEKIARKLERGEALTDKQTAFAEDFMSESVAIMAEQALGNAHFARELLDADASVVEKLLHRIEDVKEALVRRKDAAAKEAFEEVRKAEQMFLDALAEKGMRFEKGKIIGANEEDEVKKSAKSVDEFSYDYFIAKEDMPITEIDDSITYLPNKITREDIVEKAMKNALSVGTINNNGNPVVHVDDINVDVAFGKNGVKHGLDRRLGINAPVTVKAGEIIKNAIKINDMNTRKQTIDSSYLLVGVAKNQKNEPYIVLFEVNRYSNTVMSIDVMYSLNAKNEKDFLQKNKNRLDPKSPSSQVVPATLTDSTISIAQLLDFVNRYFPDILPMDVLKHYGHTSRPDGVLGQGVKHSRKTTAKTVDNLPIEAKLPEDPRTLELRGDQRKALANWSRNKVYTLKDATEIVDGVIKVIGEIAAENSVDGKEFHAAKVLKKVREKSIDQLFADLNTASTATEREAAARKVADNKRRTPRESRRFGYGIGIRSRARAARPPER